MEKIQAATPVENGEERTSPPWGRALMGGAVFGTLGAAAIHWLGHHSLSLAERKKPAFGRTWSAAIAGIASGTVAIYSTLRAEDKPPRSVYPDAAKDKPEATISTDSVAYDSVIPSPGQRSL